MSSILLAVGCIVILGSARSQVAWSTLGTMRNSWQSHGSFARLDPRRALRHISHSLRARGLFSLVFSCCRPYCSNHRLAGGSTRRQSPPTPPRSVARGPLQGPHGIGLHLGRAMEFRLMQSRVRLLTLGLPEVHRTEARRREVHRGQSAHETGPKLRAKLCRFLHDRKTARIPRPHAVALVFRELQPQNVGLLLARVHHLVLGAKDHSSAVGSAGYLRHMTQFRQLWLGDDAAALFDPRLGTQQGPDEGMRVVSFPVSRASQTLVWSDIPELVPGERLQAHHKPELRSCRRHDEARASRWPSREETSDAHGRPDRGGRIGNRVGC